MSSNNYTTDTPPAAVVNDERLSWAQRKLARRRIELQPLQLSRPTESIACFEKPPFALKRSHAMDFSELIRTTCKPTSDYTTVSTGNDNLVIEELTENMKKQLCLEYRLCCPQGFVVRQY
jgi:hypothetical protein